MGKMHELLAVESGVAGNYARDLQETVHVFGTAKNFMKEMAEKRHFDAENTKLDTTEKNEMKTTVPERFQWFSEQVVKYLDVQVQKDKTNQKAVADIILENGKVLYKDVPATTLLGLESKLGTDLRKAIIAAPTLDAGVVWNFDSAQSLYMNTPPKTFITKKVTTAAVLYPATDKHPAQVEKVVTDVPIAEINRVVYSGMITTAQKAELLSKLDELVAAVKKARQRANTTEVVSAPKFGETIMGFIFDGLKLGA
jgi:hypothetical protein